MHIAKQKSNVIKKDQLFLDHKNKGWGGVLGSFKASMIFVLHMSEQINNTRGQCYMSFKKTQINWLQNPCD